MELHLTMLCVSVLIIFVLQLQMQLVQGSVYNVGVLMVNNSLTNRFDVQRIGPAINIAAASCMEDYDVPLRLLEGYYPYRCSEVNSVGKATDLTSKYNITAFVGPACSDDVQVVGWFATYKNIPILTGLGDVLKKRDDFVTLIRMSYDLGDKAQAITAFLKHFKWRYIGIVYRQNDIYYGTLANEFLYLARHEGLQIPVSCIQTYVRAKDKTVLSDLHQIMKNFKSCARVIIILGGDREVRSMMVIAKNLGMTEKGDYVFLYPELFQNEAKGNQSWSRGEENETAKLEIKEAYKCLLIVCIHQPYSEEYTNFSEEVKRIALEKYNFKYPEPLVNYFSASFHDALILLCKAINEISSAGKDPQDGKLLSENLKNRYFHGITGNVTVNKHGDRIADYALLSQVDTENGNFEVVLVYYGATKVYVETRDINWKGGKVPVDRPRCGFDGNDPTCLQTGDLPILEISFAVTCALTILLLVLGIFTYRKVKLETALQNMSWRVKWDDITFAKDPRSSWMMNRLSITSAMSSKMERGWVCWMPNYGDGVHMDSPVCGPDYNVQYVLTGIYKGSTVAIKKLGKQKRIELTRSLRMELKKIREAQHQNVVAFVGVCIDLSNVSLLTEYCPKGSLQDVLKNNSLELDWMFRYSLINDIVKGVSFLHNGELGTHGRLRSTNCLVDSRFVVKLSDFGIPTLRKAESFDNAGTKEQTKLLWKAPELLRLPICPMEGSQKADVYSFGIILQEIAVRSEPFYPYRESMTLTDILNHVRNPDGTVFRPVLPADSCSKGMLSLIQKCWSEEPDERPDFATIKAEMRVVTRGQNGDVNIMDNLLSRMEQYANNLEFLVEQRTAAFLEEKKKSEELLYQVLPRSVAEQLKRGNSVDPEFFESVTIYFSDVVGFTSMCSTSNPIEVVDFLNDLYTCFDSIISDFDVYKVETIGDAYMVVSGLPDRNGYRHAREIARMALALLTCVNSFHIRHRPNEKLKLRIGIHSGPCCTGVVGQKMPRYCLFGDTVNTASRMESTGEPLKIHVSADTKLVLDHFGCFILIARDQIEVKGKGKMQTYWLVGEMDVDKKTKKSIDPETDM